MNIYNIAEKAGVSIATVSRVINGNSAVSSKTRLKVELVMEEMGYSPNAFARGLMVDSMKMIGIMTSDLRDIYYASAVQTIENEMRTRGYDVILCCTGDDIKEKKKYLKLLLNKRVDGIILVGSVFKEKADNSHIINTAKKVPVVMINGHVEAQNIYSILCDDAAGMCAMTKELIAKGRKNIAYIYDVDTLSGYEKILGYKKALKENNINFNQDLIIKTYKGLEGGVNAIRHLEDKRIKYDAVIASEDLIAVGAMKTLINMDIKVPSNVSVCGFNNSVISKCSTPELTTVDSKVEAVSSGAVKILCDALEGKNVATHTRIQPDLIVRQST